MKITNSIIDTGHFLRIDTAEYIGFYQVKLHFNDGKEVVMDFQSFLESNHHPDIRKYLEKNEFQSFVIKNGNLNWNDFEMIFPIEDLYNADIEHKSNKIYA